MFFATVQFAPDHKHKLAKDGEFELQVMNSFADFYMQLGNSKFVAIESSQYFEACRHTLHVLQTHTEKTFPMEQFIVRSDFKENTPRYITGDEVFDLSCLVDDKRNMENMMLYSSLFIRDLDPKQCQAIGFDVAQANAFKAAMSKKFIAIQGPPGTGKSYITVRIVRTLLYNKSIWSMQRYDKNFNLLRKPQLLKIPIIVMAYKNHALDYLLNKITESTPLVRIVRFGYTEHEKVKKCLARNLMDKRKGFHFKHERELQGILDALSELGPKIYQISSGHQLLGEELKIYMDREIVDQFNKLQNKYRCRNFNQTVAKWLGLELYDEVAIEDTINRARHRLELLKPKQHRTETQLARARQLEHRLKRSQLGHEHGEWHDPTKTTAKKYMPSPVSVEGINKLKHHMPAADIKRLQYVLEVEQILKQNISVKKVGNIEEWSLDERRRQYNNWVQFQLEVFKNQLKLLTKRYEELSQKLFEARSEMLYNVAHNADIVGVTITGAAKYKNVIEMLQPKQAIIEEAAEILEPHLVASLTKSMEQVILIGDHKQLRPLVTDSQQLVSLNFDISLFERMVSNKMDIHTLETQHRMRPDIAKLLHPEIYDILYDGNIVKTYPNVVDMLGKNVYFFDGYGREKRDSKVLTQLSNEQEARFLLELTRFFLMRGVPAESISIIAAYRGQVELIKKLMQNYKPKWMFIKEEKVKNKDPSEKSPRKVWVPKMHIGTIDSYQGEENDIVIVSFVRSGNNIGFLKMANRVNVALSRAKHGLYCFGSFTKYAQQSDFWASVVKKLKQKNAIGDGFLAGCDDRPVVMYNAESLKRQNMNDIKITCHCPGGLKRLMYEIFNPKYQPTRRTLLPDPR